MNPKQVLTTDYKNQIDLVFAKVEELDVDAVIRCRVLYDYSGAELILTGHQQGCTIPGHRNHSRSQKLVITPTYDGIHSISSPANFTLTIASPVPRVLEEQSFVSSDGFEVIVVFDRPIAISHVHHIYLSSKEVCDQSFTNSTLTTLNSFGLIHCKWLTRRQLFVSLSSPITDHSIALAFKEQTIKEFGQRIAQNNSEVIDVSVKKRTDTDQQSRPQLVLRGPTRIPQCGPFTISAHFYRTKGITGVTFKWSVTTLPPSDLISELVVSAIDTNNRTSILLMAEMFSLHSISYKFTVSAMTDGKSLLEASHQMYRSTDQLPIVAIYPTQIPDPKQVYSHQR